MLFRLESTRAKGVSIMMYTVITVITLL